MLDIIMTRAGRFTWIHLLIYMSLPAYEGGNVFACTRNPKKRFRGIPEQELTMLELMRSSQEDPLYEPATTDSSDVEGIVPPTSVDEHEAICIGGGTFHGFEALLGIRHYRQLRSRDTDGTQMRVESWSCCSDGESLQSQFDGLLLLSTRKIIHVPVGVDTYPLVGPDVRRDCLRERRSIMFHGAGVTLHEFRRSHENKEVPLLVTLKFGMMLLGSIQDLHSSSRAHGNLSPRNIFVTTRDHQLDGVALANFELKEGSSQAGRIKDLHRIFQVLVDMTPSLYLTCSLLPGCRAFESLTAGISLGHTGAMDYAAAGAALASVIEEVSSAGLS